MRQLKSLKDCIELSNKVTRTREVGASFTIDVQGESWKVYGACIAYRDILLLTEQGTVTLLVDSNGARLSAEMTDWERVA